MTVVIDCNVIVSAAWAGGICLSVVRYCVERDLVVVSPAILAEYRRVEGYRKFDRIRPRLAVTIDAVMSRAVLVDDTNSPTPLPDPQDEAYVAAALAAGADCVVTGNLKHFPDRVFAGLRILSVRDFAVERGIVG